MPARRLVLALVLLAAATGCNSGSEPGTITSSTFRAPGTTTSTTARKVVAPERPVYVLKAALDLGANTVAGSVEVTFAPDLATDRLVFRLWPNGPTPARFGGHIDTGQATVDDQPVASRLDGVTTLVVETGARAKGEVVRASVPFSVTLPGRSDDRLARHGESVRLGSWFPILAWEPGVGWATEPPTAGFAEASLSTAADFTVDFAAPPGLTVMATGVQESPGRWTADDVPDWAASVGRFRQETATVDGVKVTVGVDSQVNETPGKYMGGVTEAIRQMSARYGAYPWPAYELAITPNLGGGIEYPGHVMQGPGTHGRTTTHEVAHQWFYALVGSNQGRDPWLDEGLATWAEARVLGTLDSLRARTLPAGGRGHMGEPMAFWETRKSIYYRSVYLQPLHALMGLGASPERIDEALAEYVRENSHRVATRHSFMAAIGQVSPDALTVFDRFGVRVTGGR